MSIIPVKLIQNLNSNGVVVYPTSTLPGLGCLPNKLALDNLYRLKNRPAGQPVSLGVADLKQATKLVNVPTIAVDILQNFPRGSLTLILDAVTKLDDRLGGDRVAVRVLAHERAIELVKAVGPITATSANHSGVEPVFSTKLAAEILGLGNEGYVDGECPGGAPSTILSIDKSEIKPDDYTVTIIREGVIPRTDVETWTMNYR